MMTKNITTNLMIMIIHNVRPIVIFLKPSRYIRKAFLKKDFILIMQQKSDKKTIKTPLMQM